MSTREIRRVPENWEPNREVLFSAKDYAVELAGYEATKAKWADGKTRDYEAEMKASLDTTNDTNNTELPMLWRDATQSEINAGLDATTDGPPNRDDFMPDWSEDETTHYMYFHDDRPISPAMENLESLAEWLTDEELFGGDNQQNVLDFLKNIYKPQQERPIEHPGYGSPS